MSVQVNIVRGALALAGLAAVIAAPFITLGAAAGGYIGFTKGEKLAQKKYGSRDLGGIFPGAIMTLSIAAAGTTVGGGLGYALSETFNSEQNSQEVSQVIDYKAPALDTKKLVV